MSLLRLLGKRDNKIAVVFATNTEPAHEAVKYLVREIPDLPVWLFSTIRPRLETESLCKQAYWQHSSIILLIRAQICLWPHRVAICVGNWDGGHGSWPIKLAPFLIPPFRVLLRNGNGDFLKGSAVNVILHAKRRLHDTLNTQWNSAKDHLQAALLTGVGTMLGWCGYPHRRWFARVHGDSKPDLAPIEPGRSTEVVRFVATAPRWYGDALERFARSTDARWILWQQDRGDPVTVDDLVSLFSDAGTFAVSRQGSFRAWKPMLFPMAAFRTLSPGEATAVLAPINRTILVDRAKLLSLGIPRCRRPETAWMLCFWKAAAAGWRSYSVGQSVELQEQPDFPIPETEFMWHLLRHSSLQRLGPSEPDRLRGNIVFATSSRRAQPRTDRMRVQLVSPFLPYPLTHGGAVRIYNLCRELSGQVDFVLVTIREMNEVVDYARLSEVFKEVYVVDLDEPTSAEDTLPDQVRQHQSRSMRAVIREVAARWRPDILQIEYTHMAGFRDAAPHIPAILVEHDLTFALYRQLAERQPGVAVRREYDRWLEFERRWLAAYNGVWTMSDEDRQRAASESKRDPGTTFVVPNAVDTKRFVPAGAMHSPVPQILYVGSFRHLPNVLGYQNLRNEIMPRVWSRIPAAQLKVVAGPQHEEFRERFASEAQLPDTRVEVRGFVEDLRPLYANATVVVAPLGVSAGTNIKVLEALACGKAIVTTAVGAAGLGLCDGHDAVIRDGWDEFADAICNILEDQVLRTALEVEARRTAESRFSWAKIAGTAYEIYTFLVGNAGKYRPKRVS